jgi:prephenate dehydratase
MERAYDVFKMQNPQDGASKVDIMIGESMYQIDVACLTQMNVGTRRVRPIRRQLIAKDAENHRALAKIKHLEQALEQVREQLAAEEPKRKSAEAAQARMEQRWRQADGAHGRKCWRAAAANGSLALEGFLWATIFNWGDA